MCWTCPVNKAVSSRLLTVWTIRVYSFWVPKNKARKHTKGKTHDIARFSVQQYIMLTCYWTTVWNWTYKKTIAQTGYSTAWVRPMLTITLTPTDQRERAPVRAGLTVDEQLRVQPVASSCVTKIGEMFGIKHRAISVTSTNATTASATPRFVISVRIPDCALLLHSPNNVLSRKLHKTNIIYSSKNKLYLELNVCQKTKQRMVGANPPRVQVTVYTLNWRIFVFSNDLYLFHLFN